MRFRRGRSGRPPPVPHPGDLVIDGHVRARLLGLHLLDLEAHVVVGSVPRVPQRTGRNRDAPREIEVHTAGPLPDAAGGARGRAAPGVSDAHRNGSRRRGTAGDALPLAHARALLDEGSTVLAATRRMR